MKTKHILLCGAFATLFLVGCDPDKSGDTQKMSQPSAPPAQMPRSKEEAQKMFQGGGNNPVAPPSTK